MTNTLTDDLFAALLGYMGTPRDAVRFAAASKHLLRVVEPATRYRSMHAAAGDNGALGWLRSRAGRIDDACIDCADASLQALREAHALAQGTRIRLDMDSQLFDRILAMLARDGAGMTSLLKRHVAELLGGAARDSVVVRNLKSSMLDRHGYDADHDAYARASFAWNCFKELPVGAHGQLRLQLHLWQSADERDCEFHFDVERSSDNDLLHSTAWVRGGEHTDDWWMAAAKLYTEVKQYEFWPLEEADGSEFDDDSGEE